jgi:diacylglycerol O-acyltransferase
VATKRVSPVDAAWLVLESRDTPMHVGGLFEFTNPPDAPPDYLRQELERMRSEHTIPRPWNLKLIEGPVVGPRLPFMREDDDLDLDYHVRHSALPKPGGQRELGILVSRLHSHQLDLHRPLWELHLIEGLEENRFAMYLKMHHSLIDGVSGIRLILRTLSTDPDARGLPAFWTIGEGSKGSGEASANSRPSTLGRVARTMSEGAQTIGGLGRAAAQLGSARFGDSELSAPYDAPDSILGGHLGGQRRFATQQYDLALIRSLAKAAGGTLNDIVLYLSSTALRKYLLEHGKVPARSLTAGIPVNLREADDQSAGTAVGMVIAQLATNVADPRQRLNKIKRATVEAKKHLAALPPVARTPYTLLLSAPYLTGLMAGLGGRAPVPFNVAISNVPGPTETLYYNGARLDAMFPLSLLLHGSALNITCLSYAGTLNFGFTGARDTLPHLQRLAPYMREALDELEEVLLGSGPAS